MSDAEDNKCFTFWENWYLLAEGRDTDEKRLAFYDALFRFAFEGEIPPKPKRGDMAKVWAAYDAYLAASQSITRNMELREQGRHGGLNGKGASKARLGNQNARKHPKEDVETQAETQAQTQAECKPNASQTQATVASQTQPNKIKENKIRKNNINHSIPITEERDGNGNGNGVDFGFGKTKKDEVIALVSAFVGSAEQDENAFFDADHDPTVICAALAGDTRSMSRWTQMVKRKGESAVREEAFAMWREIKSGEEPNNRGAALNARLSKLKDIEK